MPTVKAEDLGPGVTAITWKGVIYTADADGNIEVDDDEFDVAHVEEQGEIAQAAAERRDRTANEAAPTMEPKEAKDDSPPAGQSEAEAEDEGDTPSAPRRGRPPKQPE